MDQIGVVLQYVEEVTSWFDGGSSPIEAGKEEAMKEIDVLVYLYTVYQFQVAVVIKQFSVCIFYK